MLFGSSTNLKFNERGLIPAIIQNHEDDKKVLMYVYMTKDAVKRSRKSGELYIYNRKKKKTWKKGSKSGRTMEVVDMFVHHDRNVLLVHAIPHGAACHTGNETCFYHSYLDEPKELPEDLGTDEEEGDGLAELKKLFENDQIESEVEIVESSEVEEDDEIVSSFVNQADESSKLQLVRDEEKEKSEPVPQEDVHFKKDELTIRKIVTGIQKDGYSADIAASGSSFKENIAQKIGEEAMQLALCTAHGDQKAVAQKSAEMIYQLVKLNAMNQSNVSLLEENLKAIIK